MPTDVFESQPQLQIEGTHSGGGNRHISCLAYLRRTSLAHLRHLPQTAPKANQNHHRCQQLLCRVFCCSPT